MPASPAVLMSLMVFVAWQGLFASLPSSRRAVIEEQEECCAAKDSAVGCKLDLTDTERRLVVTGGCENGMGRQRPTRTELCSDGRNQSWVLVHRIRTIDNALCIPPIGRRDFESAQGDVRYLRRWVYCVLIGHYTMHM